MSEIGPNLSEVAVAPAEASPPTTSSNDGEVPSGSTEPHPPEMVGKENSPEEQFGRNVLDAEIEIGKSLREGKYTDPRQIESAQRIVDKNYDVKELLTLLNDTKESEIALKAYEQMSQNVFVSIDGKTYSLSALEAEKAGANEARKAQIDEIITRGTYELSFDKGKFQDAALSRETEALQRKIDERRAKGENTKTYEDLLKALKTADEIKGKARAFMVDIALRRLWGSGLTEDPTELGRIINESADSVGQSELEILNHAVLEGYAVDEAKGIVAAIRKGDFALLKKIGYFSKPGVDRLFVGRELSEKEWNEILGLISEKKGLGKDEVIMALLMALVGVTQATRQAVMGELKR